MHFSGLPSVDTLLQDLRYTFRTLKRDAGFAAFAILIVGLRLEICGAGSSAKRCAWPVVEYWPA